MGRGGRVFKFYKFRSMRANAEDMLKDLLKDNEMDGPVFKMANDPRITRVGLSLIHISSRSTRRLPISPTRITCMWRA